MEKAEVLRDNPAAAAGRGEPCATAGLTSSAVLFPLSLRAADHPHCRAELVVKHRKSKSGHALGVHHAFHNLLNATLVFLRHYTNRTSMCAGEKCSSFTSFLRSSLFASVDVFVKT